MTRYPWAWIDSQTLHAIDMAKKMLEEDPGQAELRALFLDAPSADELIKRAEALRQ